MVRVYGVADPTDTGDPAYVNGLRAAVEAAVSYGLGAIDGPDGPPAPIPPALVAQARHAAQNDVGLETVLRRYYAGYVLIADFLIQVAEEGRAGGGEEELLRLWRALAAHFDRLLAAVAAEHLDESSSPGRDAEQLRAERVRRLLAGELLETADLAYEFDAWHLGAVAAGPGARVAMRRLASALDCQALVVQAGAGAVWAWLGGQRRVDSSDALRLASTRWPQELALALGEAGEGIGGWRLTHRQAKAATPIALRGVPSLVRYADVALLASALGDEVLADSLRETYLVPLEEEHDAGISLRRTLRAYFAAGRNLSSAAAALGVNRQTVKNRLSLVESRIGCRLDDCAAEMETALRLGELDVVPSTKREPV